MTEPRPPFPLVDWPEVKTRDYHNEIKAERDLLREALNVAIDALKGIEWSNQSTSQSRRATNALAQINKFMGGENESI